MGLCTHLGLRSSAVHLGLPWGLLQGTLGASDQPSFLSYSHRQDRPAGPGTWVLLTPVALGYPSPGATSGILMGCWAGYGNRQTLPIFRRLPRRLAAQAPTTRRPHPGTQSPLPSSASSCQQTPGPFSELPRGGQLLAPLQLPYSSPSAPQPPAVTPPNTSLLFLGCVPLHRAHGPW